MADRNTAFKHVMSELKGKIREYGASRHRPGEDVDDDTEESGHDESTQEENEEDEEPEGPDLCDACGEKTDVAHKFCANCGAKK